MPSTIQNLMLFEEFQGCYATMAVNLDTEQNDSAILNLHFTLMPQIKFRLNLTFEEFKEGHCGGNLGYRNGKILAILNFCVTVTPPINFQLIR